MGDAIKLMIILKREVCVQHGSGRSLINILLVSVTALVTCCSKIPLQYSVTV